MDRRRQSVGWWWAAVLTFSLVCRLLGADTLPPAPTRYFNDYAGVVDAASGQKLNAKLEAFERSSSNQIVVAIFLSLPQNTFLEDFTVKTAQAWGVGEKKRDNGIVLFVFITDRKMRIEVGYGLEGRVPDSIAAAIIREQIRPAFKASNYALGIERGIDSLIAATRGEYQGNGKTVEESKGWPPFMWLVLIIFAIFMLRLIWFALFHGDIIFANRRQSWIWNFMELLRAFAIFVNSQPPRSSGGWSSGGGGWSSSGGGFSGGGGSFGGGGASGDW